MVVKDLSILKIAYDTVNSYAIQQDIMGIKLLLEFDQDEFVMKISYKEDYYSYTQNVTLNPDLEYEIDEITNKLKNEIDKLKKRLS